MEVVKTFFDIGVLKFGSFVVKSGGTSPIYIDLRSIISYPNLLKMISKKVWEAKSASAIDADVICGVPYTALPIATTLSITEDIPMVMKRKEAKSYGTKKMVEGIIKEGDKCLIIEDIVTSGSSVLETVDVLRKIGLTVTDCIVIIDRQQGGLENLAKAGVKLHALFQISTVLDILVDLNLCPPSVINEVREYFKKASYISIKPSAESENGSSLNDVPINAIQQKLCKIIKKKKTNLCVAADVETSAELLQLADMLGPEICILKTHIDVLVDFNETVPIALSNLAKKHNFLIMEDRKFADIGSTVIHQYRSGLYKIQDWADIVTVHSIPGDGVVDALKSSAVGDKACMLIAQMSSKGTLTSVENYTEETVKIAEKHKDFVIGFISQSKISSSDFIHVSPGVSLDSAGDNLGQQYRTPQDAILRDKIDVIIVGRGITKASNVLETARKYKESAFKAYNDSNK